MGIIPLVPATGAWRRQQIGAPRSNLPDANNLSIVRDSSPIRGGLPKPTDCNGSKSIEKSPQKVYLIDSIHSIKRLL
jgi:hypothetical protein